MGSRFSNKRGKDIMFCSEMSENDSQCLGLLNVSPQNRLNPVYPDKKTLGAATIENQIFEENWKSENYKNSLLYLLYLLPSQLMWKE